MQLDGIASALDEGWTSRIPLVWRAALIRLSLAWLGLIALAWAEWAEMARQWWDASTYNHILLIPPILFWLVRQRFAELMLLTPSAWWPGLIGLISSLMFWRMGVALEINLFSQLGAVAMLQAAATILLGPRVTWALLFPLGYMLLLVPFGDELIPALQGITAKLAVWLTHLSGVPAVIDGIFIDTPAGLFEVAEACSGVKFLVAMVALGTLVAHLCFASARRRLLFMAAAVIVPVMANGIRAWGTIYIAQSQGVEFAAGFDHIVYGWIFFALVMAAVIGGSWRYFDRSPEDPLIDVAGIESSSLLAKLAQHEMAGWNALAAIAILACAVAWIDRLARIA